MKSIPPKTQINYLSDKIAKDGILISDSFVKYVDEYSLLIVTQRINPEKIYLINTQDKNKCSVFPIDQLFNILDCCIIMSETIHALCFLTNSKFIFYDLKTKVVNYEDINNYQKPLKIKWDRFNSRLFVFYQNVIKIYLLKYDSNATDPTSGSKIKVTFFKTFDSMGDNDNIIKSNFSYPYGIFVYEQPILTVSEFRSDEKQNILITTKIPKNFNSQFLCGTDDSQFLNSTDKKIKCIDIEINKTILAISLKSNIYFYLIEKEEDDHKFSILKVIEKAHIGDISNLKKFKLEKNIYIATSDGDELIKFWNLNTFENDYTINTNSKIENFYFSEKNKSLIVVDDNFLIKTWQINDLI